MKKRYRGLLENIDNGAVFKKGTTVKWKCDNCGYIYKGESAPEECPACAHPKAYYEMLCENR